MFGVRIGEGLRVRVGVKVSVSVRVKVQQDMSVLHLAAATPQAEIFLIQHQTTGDIGGGPDLFAFAILKHLFGRPSSVELNVNNLGCGV